MPPRSFVSQKGSQPANILVFPWGPQAPGGCSESKLSPDLRFDCCFFFFCVLITVFLVLVFSSNLRVSTFPLVEWGQTRTNNRFARRILEGENKRVSDCV